VPPYVLDFYCETARLAVELDGSQHTDSVDAKRELYLGSLGIMVLRFWDNDVLTQTESVLEKILTSIQDRTLTPNPSPGGRGEKQRSTKP
jgi:very-short-patch-repair endonuclease